jgi:uncharacterized membrane protein YfcA
MALNYYISLFLTKEQYTKEELKNIKPHFSITWTKINSQYNTFGVIICLFTSSLIGIYLPRILNYRFFNSIFPLVIIYFSFPYLTRHLQNKQVSESEDSSDIFAGLFIEYNQLIVLGFGLGLMSFFSINWLANPQMYSFLLFAANVIGSIILLQYTLNTVLKKGDL